MLSDRVAVLDKNKAEGESRAKVLQQALDEANRRTASLEKRLEQIEAQLSLRK